jgi:hypothetical protein
VMYGDSDDVGLVAVPLVVYHALQCVFGAPLLGPLRRWGRGDARWFRGGGEKSEGGRVATGGGGAAATGEGEAAAAAAR